MDKNSVFKKNCANPSDFGDFAWLVVGIPLDVLCFLFLAEASQKVLLVELHVESADVWQTKTAHDIST